MRVLFYGTPAFALPTLQALRERHHVRKGQEDDFNLRHPTEIA